MHCIRLADLAATLAQNGPQISLCRKTMPPHRMTDYWVATRTRLDLWHQAMARNRMAYEAGDWIALQRWWNEHLVVLEEILVADMLTRVVAGLAMSIDRQCEEARGCKSDVSMIGHAVHLSQLEARNRVQLLMLNNRGCRVPDAVRLNRLRRTSERWTDTWLGRLSVRHPECVCYALDRGRAVEHGHEFRESLATSATSPSHSTLVTSDRLMQAAMRDTLSRQTQVKPALPAANRQVAESVLAMIPAEVFGGNGVPKSLARCRIETDVDAAERDPSCEDRVWWQSDRIRRDTETEPGGMFDAKLSRWFLA